jgi:hypothetical protein
MILGHALPLDKAFFSLLGTPAFDTLFLAHFVLACVSPRSRLTLCLIGRVMRGQTRHRSNVLRFLRRLPPTIAHDWIEAVFGNLLSNEPIAGDYLFIIDQTYCGHQSSRMENSYSTAHRGKRQKHAPKNKLKKKKQRHQSYCHCFVFGLLITPSGVRLPMFRSYYTKEYCEQYNKKYLKQTEIAAKLIADLRVPAKAKVIVLGDTAFDAAVIHKACNRRQFGWVVPMNHDRRLAMAEPRTPIMSLTSTYTAEQYVPIRLTPGKGPFTAQRRAAACRVGPNAKPRTYWVHEEIYEVQNIGTTRVLFSTKKTVVKEQPVEVQKVLLTNDLTRSMAEIVELYDLRWQIELFFKEMKGTLGMADYQLQYFRDVEGWVNCCVLAFLYLEWYRLQMLEQSQLAAKEKERWRRQRSHGLALGVRQDVEREDIQAILEMTNSPEGLRRLQALLRQSTPKEYRKQA